MKLKAGQKVRVNKKLRNIKNFRRGYMDDMSKLEGKIVTISSINGDGDIYIEEDKKCYLWDERAFSLLKLTKKELLAMPTGTKIYTDIGILLLKDLYSDFVTGDLEYLDRDSINDDLTIDDIDFGTKIIKVEEPTYETVYDYSAEVKEMTVAEIEKELGHAVKIIKEDR